MIVYENLILKYKAFTNEKKSLTGYIILSLELASGYLFYISRYIVFIHTFVFLKSSFFAME